MASIGELQTRAASLLKSRRSDAIREGFIAPTRTTSQFTPFRPDMLERALELANHYMELANSQPEHAGLEKVLDSAERDAKVQDIDLVKYALMIFITHHSKGSYLPIPSLEERSPEAFLKKGQPSSSQLTAETVE